jgi:16S rRNA (uracil1498-N3)-methyltransferase
MGDADCPARASLMQRRRFYASPDEFDGKLVRLSPDESHHLLRVLRLTRGEEVYVFDGCGEEFQCRFAEVEGKSAVLEVIARLSDEVESPLRLTLVQALTKGEKFDWIVQKATELGVSRIIPLASEHADLKLNGEQAEKRVERWQRISLEALKQCGRRRQVEICKPCTLADFLAESSAAAALEESPAAIIFFNERGGSLINQALEALQQRGAVIALVGPEGGWSDREIECLQAQGCLAVTLGRRVLRTETAALAALTLLQHLLGDLSH